MGPKRVLESSDRGLVAPGDLVSEKAVLRTSDKSRIYLDLRKVFFLDALRVRVAHEMSMNFRYPGGGQGFPSARPCAPHRAP